MLKIAQCSDSFLPIVDGVGRVVFKYAESLALAGCESYVITPLRNSGYRGNYPFEILDFISMPIPGEPRYRAGIAAIDNHYTERANHIDFNIIHAHSPGAAGTEALRLASRLRVPLIGSFHSKYYDDFLRITHSESLAALGVKYIINFYNRCDEVWTVSSQAAATLESYGYGGNIEIMPNGTDIPDIDASEAAEAARERFLLRKEPILLFVGQIDRKKNIALILEAAALLRDRGLTFSLVFAGTGQDLDEFRTRADDLQLKNVLFLGHVSDKNLLYGLYAAATAFVFPSLYDTSGLVVREAAAMGTPSVVIVESAPSEVIVSGINGIICDNNAFSLANACEKLIISPDHSTYLGENARMTIPIPWDTVMSDVMQRYENLVTRDRYDIKRKLGIFYHGRSATDTSLEKRILDLMLHFVRQDLQNLYAYPHSFATSSLSSGKPVPAVPLERAVPESQGISSNRLADFFRRVSEDSSAAVHAMMVLRHGKVIAEGYFEPYEANLPRQLYSVSKSVVSAAVCLLIGEGKLSLDDRLISIFPEYTEISSPARAFTVRHLLTMSTGSRFNEICTPLSADWVGEFLRAGTKFQPGSRFDYNSVNTYMLAAVVIRVSGMSLTEYLRPRLFEPLGIPEAEWELCPKGLEKGGWGLSLTIESLAKIGLLFLRGGMWDGKRILNGEYVRNAISNQIDTPDGEIQSGYGYQVWMTPIKNSFLFNGAFGQYMLAFSDIDAQVIIFSGSSMIFAEGQLLELASDALTPLAEDDLQAVMPEPDNCLHKVLDSLSMRKRYGEKLSDMTLFSQLVKSIDCREYRLDSNSAGVFPLALQSVHNNFSHGITGISFREDNGKLHVLFSENDTINRLLLSPEEYTRRQVSYRDESYPVSVFTRCSSENDVPVLRIYIHFLTTPFTRVFTLRFYGDSLELTADEVPAVRDSTQLLFRLSFASNSEFYRALAPFLNRNHVRNRMANMTVPVIKGTRA